MTRRHLSDIYERLQAEERFKLILAARRRGAEDEAERIMARSQSIRRLVRDFAPWMIAYQQLALITFIELQSHVTQYTLAWAMANTEDDPECERWTEVAMGRGYLLRMKWLAWKAFCEEYHADPTGLWSVMPGYTSVMSSISMAESLSESEGELVQRLETETGKPIPSLESILDETQEIFASQVQCYGG